MTRMIKNYHAFYPKKNLILAYILFPAMLIILMNVASHFFLRNTGMEIYKALKSVISIMIPTYYLTAVIISDKYALGSIQTKNSFVGEIVKSSSKGSRFITDVIIWDIFARLLLAVAVFAGLFIALLPRTSGPERLNLLLCVLLGITASHMTTSFNVLISRKTESMFLFLFCTYVSVMFILPYAIITTLSAPNAMLAATALVHLVLDVLLSTASVLSMKKTVKKYWYSDTELKGSNDDN